jgi:hypothetical protein
VREKEAIGVIKKPNIFMNKMCIHSLFDSRKAFEILTDVFTGKYRLSQYYSAGTIHNVLKHFHQFTETFNPNANELEAPKSRMFT